MSDGTSKISGENQLEHFPPIFATNNPATHESVASKVRLLIDGSLKGLKTPPDLAIASAYINVGGFALIADQLEDVPKTRLLLGAEPESGANGYQIKDHLRDSKWLEEILKEHENWLKAERDLTGFSRSQDQNSMRLVRWLNAKDDHGNPRVEVRRFTNGFLHGKAFIIDHETHSAVLAGSSNFTAAGLSTNRELNLGYPNTGETQLVQEWFNDLWDESAAYDLASIYQEKWEEHPPWLIFMRMLYELYGDTEDDAKLESGLGLTQFQRDGVARMLRLLDAHGGVLVADEVGLGKTFLAGEVLRRSVEVDRQKALIICPAAVKASIWNPFLEKYGFSRRAACYSFDEVRIKSDDPETAEEFKHKLDDYALVVIDEAHNLRNQATQRSKAIASLLGGKYPKKIVLLTATPVNNSLFDLHTLISYFIKNDGYFASIGISSIRDYIKEAQNIDPDSLSPQHLFDLMDQIAVRRTRRFVKKNYQGDKIKLESGREETIKFPVPRVNRLDYRLDGDGNELLDRVFEAISIQDDDALVVPFSDRNSSSNKLFLARYTTSAYHMSGDLETYQIRNSGLLRSALLKRLESSPLALARTLETMTKSHKAFLSAIDSGYVLAGEALSEWTSSGGDDLDEVLGSLDEKATSHVQNASEFHVLELRQDVISDLELLDELRVLAESVATNSDFKAKRLVEELRSIALSASKLDNSGISHSSRRKTVIFSSFSDTVNDIYEKVTEAVNAAAPTDPLSNYQDRVCRPIFGAKGGTDQDQRAREIARFAPETAGQLSSDGKPISDDRYDLLFTTDVLSEGVNLQQAGRMINYDLPWNPMRLVQRSGRIDRIGSKHSYIHIGCFFPADRLDEMLHLEETLMRKLAYADAAIGTGEILPGQKALKTEVVLADTKEQIMALAEGRPDLFEQEGDMGAISGEEYRRKLNQSIKDDERYKRKMSGLPYGSGSGFISGSAKTNGYVFCIKMGAQDKTWFRYVPVDDDWNPIFDTQEDGYKVAEVNNDTLTSLSAADPGDSTTQRYLPSYVYDKAYDAWEIARFDAHRSWQYLTNPNNLMPDVEKAFRDASELVQESGKFLGNEQQGELAAKLSGRWPNEVKRAVREVLIDPELTAREMVEKLQSLAEEFGLSVPKAPEPLPAILLDEVRLLTWMAVGRSI